MIKNTIISALGSVLIMERLGRVLILTGQQYLFTAVLIAASLLLLLIWIGEKAAEHRMRIRRGRRTAEYIDQLRKEDFFGHGRCSGEIHQREGDRQALH